MMTGLAKDALVLKLSELSVTDARRLAELLSSTTDLRIRGFLMKLLSN